MKIELITVIEYVSQNQEISQPMQYPYWENNSIWYEYRKEALKREGFREGIEPYVKGYPFYEPKEITHENLKMIVLNHTKGLRNKEYEREQSCSLFGGFVLRINDENKYFPQCCGDLGDIFYWENLSKGLKSPYEGHPAPVVEIQPNKVILNFKVEENDEDFEPTPPTMILELKLNILQIAVVQAKVELNNLAERVIQINEEMNLGIKKIEDLLIWGNI